MLHQMRHTMHQLLEYMNETDSSDIYITEDALPSFRTHGIIKPILNGQMVSKEYAMDLLSSVVSKEKLDEFRETKELNVSISDAVLGRFRLNAYVQRGSTSMVIRKITTEIPTLDSLGLPEVFKDLIVAKNGFIIMVGGTGSGKSTSLAAMVNEINMTKEGHIITIEDPIEYVHSHKKCIISQREVGDDTASFQTALKNTLRQAPDVILIGEIRDRETMEHALNFAETGHLCMSTLHANNANQAIDRIINMFPHEMHDQVRLNISLNLKAIISQRLVRTIDGKRKACIEIMVGNERVKDLIAKGETGELKNAMEMGANYGMQTFDMHLVELVNEGFITEEQAILNADSKNDVRLKLKFGNLNKGNDEDDSSQSEGESSGATGAQEPKRPVSDEPQKFELSL